jgi:hypothetical protein
MEKIVLGNLAFTLHRAEVSSPGDRTSRHVVVASNFHSLNVIAILRDRNDFIEMAWVVASPLSR